MTTCTYQGIKYASNLKPKKIDQITFNYIINKVCEMFGITTVEIASKSRKANLVEARMFAVNIIKEATSLTLVKIGKLFQRDHSTIIYLIQAHNNLMRFDKAYNNKYNRMVETIQSKI